MWKYNQTPSSFELYHYGVPGMKWGIRKKRPESLEEGRTSNKTASGLDLDELGKRIDAIRGTPAGEKLARKHLKPPREEPMYKWSDDERNKFDSDYSKARSSITNAFKAEKDPSKKLNLAVEETMVELFYQDYREWD